MADERIRQLQEQVRALLEEKSTVDIRISSAQAQVHTLPSIFFFVFEASSQFLFLDHLSLFAYLDHFRCRYSHTPLCM